MMMSVTFSKDTSHTPRIRAENQKRHSETEGLYVMTLEITPTSHFINQPMPQIAC